MRLIQRITGEGFEKRSCGDCRLCCKLLKVGRDEEPEGFHKPQGVWCQHCGSKKRGQPGCMIYDRRPFDCRAYVCGWLQGLFELSDRPDKSKVVVSLEMGDTVYDPEGKPIMGPAMVWCVYESIPGVVRSNRRANRIVQELETFVGEEKSGEYSGPYPICIIPSPTGMRMVKWPGERVWTRMLRPGDIDPMTGDADPLVQK